MKKILVAPSILSADFAKLKEGIKKIEDSGADMIHIDVMDGHFVTNITIGPVIVEAVKRSTNLPLDVHLMITKPHKFIKQFVEAGSDIITIHAEVYDLEETRSQKPVTREGMSRKTNKINEDQVKKVLAQIKSFGKKAGISLNPDSPFNSIQGILKEINMILLMSVHPGFGGQKFIDSILPKIKEARKIYSGDIEVDGGITEENVKSVIDAGANIIVAGSYFFSSKYPVEAVKKLRMGY